MSDLLWDDVEGIARGQKVLLATTAYDSPDARYTYSVQATRKALADEGIQSAYCLLSGNCHVDDARNEVVREFLGSDCTDLLFLDADVSWEAKDVVRLLKHSDVDVVGGVYPKRGARSYGPPVRMLRDEIEPDENGLLPVEGLPTGFMRIKRHVLEHLSEGAEKYRKAADIVLVPIIFERSFLENVGRVGGDIHFCIKARDAGFVVAADCEVILGHTGKITHKGSLGQHLRASQSKTLQHVCGLIRERKWDATDIQEAIDYVGNLWGAQFDSLVTCIKVVESNPGDVLEAGSGLSTVLIAAALPNHRVYALEHDPIYFETTKRMARTAGVSNIGLCYAPIDPETRWYDENEMEGMPTEYSLVFLDGPPRGYGSRFTMLDKIGKGQLKAKMIVADDADNFDYRRQIDVWASENNYDCAFEQRIAVMKRGEHE